MGLHKATDRTFVTIGGSVMTSGGSLNLAKGQFGIFATENNTKDGLVAVGSFANTPKNKEFEMRLGTVNLPVARSQSDKSYSSFPFSLKDVEDISVSAPQITEQSVDEVVVGYDGINAGTAMQFNKGETKKLYVKLSGNLIGQLGYANSEVTIPVYMEGDKCVTTDCESCDPCESDDPRPIVMKAIETLKAHTLRGMTAITDFIEVTPVMECDSAPAPTTTDQNFYELTVCDTGDQYALSLVQAQYPDYEVIKLSRNGSNTTYQVVKEGVAPTDYTQKVASIFKDCEDCPTDYTAVDGGFLYAVTLVDDGADDSATVETLVGAVAGTGVKNGGENGVGFYTVVLDAVLSSANKTTFLTANPTGTVEYVDTVQAICTPDSEPTVAWVANGTCTTTVEQYEISLPDTKCGEDRLAELQAAYPYNTVAIALSDEYFKEAVVTVTGTSGTANINVNGTDYLATFNSDIETTIDDFLTSHAANLLADEGATATKASASTISIIYPTAQADVTITNASGDLAGSVVTGNGPVQHGCSTKYTIDVVTNRICDECDDMYKDYYTSGTPEPYDQTKWVKSADIYEGLTGCLMGIRIKGKKYEIHPEDDLRDTVGFEDSSVKIEVNGGYITEMREGIGERTSEDFNVVYKSRWIPRTHLGGSFYDDEDRSRMFFTGESRYRGSDLGRISRVLKGQETHLISSAQYVDYAITVRRRNKTQSFGGELVEPVTFHILAEVGRHQDVEALVNSLAGAAGLDGVKAFGA